MSKYAIWNKKDNIYTPSGAKFTAQQWIERYPIAELDSVTVVCGGGEMNGSFFSTLGQMMERAVKQGCDFTGCNTPEEKLAAIEAFDDAKAAEAAKAAKLAAENEAYNAELNAMSLASIAASMEYQNMLTLPDEEV